jgi:hypothetical protein
MNQNTKKRLLHWYLALIYTFGLLAATGSISWGVWYSVFPEHRLQTDAILHGKLALSDDPTNLGHDLCWSQGGVNQVWGLGIPIWRIPFELLARLFGMSPFPDRLAMAGFMFAVAYVVFKTWPLIPIKSGPWSITVFRSAYDAGFVSNAGVCLLILLFPPITTLLCYRMWVYEEVMVYVYFYGVMLSCGIVALARNPTWGRYYLICWLAGIGGFIRPTLVLYGFSTIAMAVLIMIFYGPTGSHSRTGGAPVGNVRRTCRLSFGAGIFVTGGALLFITNYLRFGSGWEFGHRLNLQREHLLISVYSTRFDYPFRHVPIWEAARELFGALFMVNKFNGLNWYSSDIFPMQSSTIRWREFSFDTYDLSYAVFIGTAWLSGLWVARKSFGSCNKGEKEPHKFRPSENTAIILWSVLVSALLIGFYIKAPVIASRYMLDFAPAFAMTLAGGLRLGMDKLAACKTRQLRWVAVFCISFISVWLTSETIVSKTMKSPPQSLTRNDVSQQMVRSESPFKQLPSGYQTGDFIEQTKIPYNGAGWNSKDGETSVCIIFFVDNPEYLQLDLSLAPHAVLTETALDSIQAKVGLEFLKRTSVIHTNDIWILRFSGPTDQRYKKGLQPVFIAMVPPEELERYTVSSTPWILGRLTWKHGQ